MSNPIFNSFRSAELSVTEQIDPSLIKVYATSIADQINKFRMSYKPQKNCKDLSEWIADIILETTAQGASLMEVHVVDPAWTLLMKDSQGVSFIDVDEQGYIWPPVEVTFPQNVSEATWRLAQLRPSTSLTEANLILTFEDKIASELREHSGQQSSHSGQTRAEFIQHLIKDANDNPAYSTDVKIRFVPLLPHSTFTKADLTMSSLLPVSATQKNPPKARKDHKKGPRKDKPRQFNSPGDTIDGVNIKIGDGADAFGKTGPGQPITNNPLFNPFQGVG